MNNENRFSVHFRSVWFIFIKRVLVNKNIILFQGELTIPPEPKVKILSNILIRPPYHNGEASTSANFTQNSEAIDNSHQIMTPRKRKLLNKLSSALKLSMERKKKLVLTRKKLVRRDKRVATMKNIIAELQKNKFMQDEYLDVISKLGGPEELYLRQYKKGTKQALPRQYSEKLKVFALTLHYYSPAA